MPFFYIKYAVDSFRRNFRIINIIWIKFLSLWVRRRRKGALTRKISKQLMIRMVWSEPKFTRIFAIAVRGVHCSFIALRVRQITIDWLKGLESTINGLMCHSRYRFSNWYRKHRIGDPRCRGERCGTNWIPFELQMDREHMCLSAY